MKRRLFELQNYDTNTGEVTTVSKLTVENHNETFGMHRTTEGIDWVFKFTGAELQMLIVLLEVEDLKSNVVELSSLKRQHLITSFGISAKSFNRILRQLEDKNALTRMTHSDIILNPLFFHKGGTKEWKKKYSNYKECRLNKFSVQETSTHHISIV